VFELGEESLNDTKMAKKRWSKGPGRKKTKRVKINDEIDSGSNCSEQDLNFEDNDDLGSRSPDNTHKVNEFNVKEEKPIVGEFKAEPIANESESKPRVDQLEGEPICGKKRRAIQMEEL
jgi:hypothetical protein